MINILIHLLPISITDGSLCMIRIRPLWQKSQLGTSGTWPLCDRASPNSWKGAGCKLSNNSISDCVHWFHLHIVIRARHLLLWFDTVRDSISLPVTLKMHICLFVCLLFCFLFSCDMGLLPDTQKCGLSMRRECRERFPRQRLQRKSLVSHHGMHHGTCVTHVPWCMSGSLTRCGGKNVPSILGACATRSFAGYIYIYIYMQFTSCEVGPFHFAWHRHWKLMTWDDTGLGRS